MPWTTERHAAKDENRYQSSDSGLRVPERWERKTFRPTACATSDRPTLRSILKRAGENRSVFGGTYGKHRLCNKLAIADGADTIGKGIEPDESCSITLLIDIVFTERDKALVVQCIFACATHNCHCSFVHPECDTACDTLLRDVDECIIRFTLGGPPASLVNEVCIARRDEILRCECAAIENQLLERAVRSVEQGTARCLVHST